MENREDSVLLVRAIKASTHKVFAAWTGPGLLQGWLAPKVEADARIGGRFRIKVQDSHGLHTVAGEYWDLAPGRRLVKTWIYEGPLAPGKIETLVTAEFREIGPEAAELRVREEGPALADGEKREEGRQAWSAALEKLEALYKP